MDIEKGIIIYPISTIPRDIKTDNLPEQCVRLELGGSIETDTYLIYNVAEFSDTCYYIIILNIVNIDRRSQK